MLKTVTMSLALGLCLALAGCAAPEEAVQGIYTGTLVLEGRHVIAAGETLPGALFVLDGQVELEPGARLDGPAFLLGGDFEVGGEAARDISVFGGRLAAGPGAQIGGTSGWAPGSWIFRLRPRFRARC